MAGISVASAGHRYTNPYEGGIAYSVDSLRSQREDAQRAVSDAITASGAAEQHLALGQDAGASARAIESASALIDELDTRIATAIAFGPPLAKRSVLRAALADAEMEVVAAQAVVEGAARA